MYLEEKNNHIIDNSHLFEIERMFEMIRTTFDEEVAKRISHVRFYRHELNKTYFIAKYNNLWVQIRIPKHKFDAECENEFIVIKHFKDYIFAKDGIYIKKWFPGEDLFHIKFKKVTIYSIFNCVKSFHECNIEVQKFNWNKFIIQDKKYHELLHKYKDEEQVLSHNNIQKHNIIVNKYNFVKLVDMDSVSLNSPYFDFVLLHINIGIDKKMIIDYFNLDKDVFDDYIYLVNTYREAEYESDYRYLTINKDIIPESLNVYKTRTSIINNKFIVHKHHNQFDNRLKIKTIEDFYFVPTFIYEDENKIIWRWLTRKDKFQLTHRTIKILAKIMRTYHDSNVQFPNYILYEKIKWYLDNVNKKDLVIEIGSNDLISQIVNWIKEIEIDANCHNNLNFENILWDDNQGIYVIDWSIAYRSSRYLDIAFMFENLKVNKNIEEQFWRSYNKHKPLDFYRYRIMALFVHYLQNKVLNNDDKLVRNIANRIKEILIEDKS
ncbi:hypothetical protein ACWXVJ_00300 [Mycoplasma sp. 773]